MKAWVPTEAIGCIINSAQEATMEILAAAEDHPVRKLVSRTLLVGLFVSIQALVAGPIVVSTGDLGLNIISNGGSYTANLSVLNPSLSAPATLTVKYGLWNSPDVPVAVSLNSVEVGDFVARWGYVSPGPEYVNFDITGLLVNGSNAVHFQGSGLGGYVIGRVDIAYETDTIPEPASISLVGLGGVLLLWLRRRGGLTGRLKPR